VFVYLTAAYDTVWHRGLTCNCCDCYLISTWSCCNLSAGVALNARFTTNGMCVKNNTIYLWREQAITEWSHRLISIVACCHSVELCAHATRFFRSQQNGPVTRMWRSCCVKPSQKERAIGAVRCKKEGMLLQPLRWRCTECAVHHERNVREEQHRIYLWREQAITEWSRRLISIVACCHSVKLCAHATRSFRSQQSTSRAYAGGGWG